MLRRSQVVAKNKIQFVVCASAACDRCNRIMRFPVCFCQDHRCFICVTAPACKDSVCKVYQLLRIFGGQTNNGHRPFHNACFDIFITLKRNLCLNRCTFHCKCIASALEMIVSQNRTADDWQVCIGTDKIMRKLTDKIQQLAEAGTIDFHRCMFFIKTNAMFIVINIWGILKIPGRTVDLHRYDPMILSGRIIQTAGIAHVFGAQHAARIIGSRQSSCGCNCLWILFRLG